MAVVRDGVERGRAVGTSSITGAPTAILKEFTEPHPAACMAIVTAVDPR